jgi:sigma-B regulation protein RsbU (phosphoserine phosphatase)
MPTDERTLLVVDDSDDNRYTLCRRLAREGYTRVLTAANGVEALALLRAQRVDLVLLDIMMPDMDGYQVLEALKGDEVLRHIPVIMISGVDQLESVVRCIELGADDYLPKPFNATLLRARVGASLEKKRLLDEVVDALGRLERELRAARDVQLAMVPTTFPPPTRERPVEIFGCLLPAREVGGDLFDFFWRDPRTLCFVVADVSDKGAPAALFMARTRTLIRLVATLTAGGAGTQHLETIVRLVNAELCADNPSVTFVTLVLGMLDVSTGALTLCNAGHPRPLRLDARGAIERCDTGPLQPPLGVDARLQHRAVAGTLMPGQTLFLYTDGITEAAQADGALFGDLRVETALDGLARESAEVLVGRVIEAARTFAGATPQADDVAAMAIRFLPLAVVGSIGLSRARPGRP